VADIKEREERKFPLLPLPPAEASPNALRDWAWALTRELQKFFGGGALQTQQIMFREDGRSVTDHDGHYVYTSAGATVVEKSILKRELLDSSHLADEAVSLFDSTASTLLTVNASVALNTPAVNASLGASTRGVLFGSSFTFDPVTAAAVLYHVHALRDGATIESWASIRTPATGGKDWGGFQMVDKSATLNTAHAYRTQVFCTATARVRSVYTTVVQLKK
jgi:hypothetical protein